VWLLLAVVVTAGLGAGMWAMHRRGRPEPVRSPAPPAPASPIPLSPAEDALRTALARLPDDPVAHLGLARYLLEQHRPAEALWHFRWVLDRRPADADGAVGLARALAQIGLPAEAIRLLKSSSITRRGARVPAKRVDGRPSSAGHENGTNTQYAIRNTEYSRALAEVVLSTARPAEALAVLNGPGLAPSAPAQMLLGDARFAAGDSAGAKAAYQRAVELEPEGAAGYDRLGRLALAASDWKAAQAVYSAARERDPGATGYGYRLGQALWGAGDRQGAEQLWETMTTTVPDYAPAQLALGQAGRRRKDWAGAATHLMAAVKSDPASKEAQFALAAVMEAQGDPASACYQRGFFSLETDRPHLAVVEFRRLMALAPDRVNGPLMTSLAYIKMQRLDLAAAAAQRGLARHPNDPSLLARLGLLYAINHNGALAQRLCEQWLKRDPNASDAAALLGRIARENQRLPEAQRFGEQALAQDPGSASNCFELSKTLAALPGPENAGRALDLAQRAAALGPGDADHWYQLGLLLRGAGRPEEAAGALLRALDRNSGSTPSCSMLVQIAAQERRPASAQFFAGLVTALEERGRVTDAFWRTVYSHPADPTAHERLAAHQLATGDLLHASYQLEQLAELRPADRAAASELALVHRILDLRRE
jgi:tetratricopeptide (TPR) repeat protein